jgi:formylglycine-generating enzyme required for sulfatase activity
MKQLILLLFLLPAAMLWAEVLENHAPTVENVRFFQRTDGSLLVDVYYDALDADNDSLEISMQVFNNDGSTWNVPCSTLSGDIGHAVFPGRGKHAVWDFFADNPRTSGSFRVRIIADDLRYRDMVYVAAGEFSMGSTSGESDERPVHKVYLDAYYIDKFEVSNAQYAAFLNAYGSDKVINGAYAGQTMIYENATMGVKKVNSIWQAVAGYENHPVVSVAWHGAAEFARYNGKRLPTEAEWEKAARGGNASQGNTYSGGNDLNVVGWYNGNSGGTTHVAGQKQANELGVYDMSGNVWEWCADWYSSSYYSISSAQNPPGPATGSSRVLRGGSLGNNPNNCRVAYRDNGTPDAGYLVGGFRCVQDR